MENNLENKAAFYGLYFNQNVVRSFLPEQSESLTKVDFGKFRIPHLIINSYLELTPLSQISDEDAVEVSIILHMNRIQTKATIKAVREMVIHTLPPAYSFKEVSNAVDFLRKNGYAVEWLGLSVEKQIEYGWVKLKEV